MGNALKQLKADERFSGITCLGQSPSGAAFRAVEGDEPVVLKACRADLATAIPDLDSRLAATVEAWRDAAVPGLAAARALFPGEGTPYLVRPFIDGQPLARAAKKRPTDAELRRFIESLFATLQALHERGFVHGNLHAGNVIVTPDGSVVLTDPLPVPRESAVFAGGAFPVAATALAPESATGPAPTTATDLFSAGALLCQRLGGRVPSSQKDLAAFRFDARRFARQGAFAAALAPLLEELLASDPAARFSSAGEARAAALAALDALPAAPAKRSRKGLLLALGIPCGLLVLLGIAWFVLSRFPVAIVAEDGLVLWKDHNAGAEKIAELARGEELVILDSFTTNDSVVIRRTWLRDNEEFHLLEPGTAIEVGGRIGDAYVATVSNTNRVLRGLVRRGAASWRGAWYAVETADGRSGWVVGKGLLLSDRARRLVAAVHAAIEELPSPPPGPGFFTVAASRPVFETGAGTNAQSRTLSFRFSLDRDGVLAIARGLARDARQADAAGQGELATRIQRLLDDWHGPQGDFSPAWTMLHGLAIGFPGNRWATNEALSLVSGGTDSGAALYGLARVWLTPQERFEYRFRADVGTPGRGERRPVWIADPAAPESEDDGYGERLSLVRIPDLAEKKDKEIEPVSVSAASTNTVGTNVHGPLLLFDGSLATCWMAGEADKATLTLVFPAGTVLSGMALVGGNGAASGETGDLFLANARVRELELVFADGGERFVLRDHVRHMQNFVFSAPRPVERLQLRVLSVYPGRDAKLPAISELLFY